MMGKRARKNRDKEIAQADESKGLDQHPPNIDLDKVRDAVDLPKGIIDQQVLMQTLMYHSGPLPSPEVFGKYDEILPGAADRILKMTEKQLEHRIENEKKMVGGRELRALLGIPSSILIMGICAAVAIVFAYQGYDSRAFWFAVISVVSLAGASAIGKAIHRSMDERSEDEVPEDNGEESAK